MRLLLKDNGLNRPGSSKRIVFCSLTPHALIDVCIKFRLSIFSNQWETIFAFGLKERFFLFVPMSSNEPKRCLSSDLQIPNINRVTCWNIIWVKFLVKKPCKYRDKKMYYRGVETESCWPISVANRFTQKSRHICSYQLNYRKI